LAKSGCCGLVWVISGWRAETIKRNGIRAKDENGFAVGDGLSEFIPIEFRHGYFVFKYGGQI
jgi:hypothetical protein